MSLETISAFDSNTALTILSAAAAFTGPSRQYAEGQSKYVDAILKEIRNRNGLDLEDNSARAKMLIDQELTTAMEEAIFETVSIDDIREQMLVDGSLPLPDHTIHQPVGSSERVKAETLHVVANPTFAQFFPAPTGAGAPGDGLYLFSQRRAKEGPNKRWSLVGAAKRGRDLNVFFAFSVYSEVINLDQIRSSEDLLERFVDHYGVLVELPDGSCAKLVRNSFDWELSKILDIPENSNRTIEEYYLAYETIEHCHYTAIGFHMFDDAYIEDIVRIVGSTY